jgi:hypothetical protein
MKRIMLFLFVFYKSSLNERLNVRTLNLLYVKIVKINEITYLEKRDWNDREDEAGHSR